ncbi:MAG: DUF1846 domain-containing protein [Clostridia bacterium]|nr:DUF1846 domain-containing protein [Clostridia bacterium]
MEEHTLNTKKTCFDSKKYLQLQSEKIKEKMKEFDNKLYMEFGGKLFDDLHASRVLPGFDPNIQIKLLDHFKKDCEIIFVINANDIEKNKIRADFGITYDMEVLRLIDSFRSRGLLVSAVVITLFNDQPAAVAFKNKLENLGERVYCHYYTKGYPTDIETIVSEEGYGKNPYVETTKPLVVITAPGPGSGKLATCLSQLYHEYKRGIKAGYAKFEKFPVWNLPLKHPVNIAYESATADLQDVNLLDSYHIETYGTMAVSYNRDLQAFPVVRNILKNIVNRDIYKSPTDMGINTIAECIFDDELAQESAKQEIVRRYYRAKVEIKKNNAPKHTEERIRLLMNELNLDKYDRKCVKPAEEKEETSLKPSVAIELNDGTIVTGRQTDLLTASASVVLNALKVISGIEDKFELISPQVLKPITDLKKNILNSKDGVLSLKDVLIALSISAEYNPFAKVAYQNLDKLNGCEAHSTHILSPTNEDTLRKLKVNMTSGAIFTTKNLFDA